MISGNPGESKPRAQPRRAMCHGLVDQEGIAAGAGMAAQI